MTSDTRTGWEGGPVSERVGRARKQPEVSKRTADATRLAECASICYSAGAQARPSVVFPESMSFSTFQSAMLIAAT